MDEGALLTLEEAATRSGYRKRDLRALLRDGRLPAVRAGGRWRIATSDLALLPPRAASQPDPPLTAVDSPPAPSADPVTALIELLRERDQKLAELQEERAQLTGQVGFLLGQLTEREERIQWLEQAALSASARNGIGNPRSGETTIALIDEWTKPPQAIPTIVALSDDTDPVRLGGDTDPRLDLESKSAGGVATKELQSDGDVTVPIADPDPLTSLASLSAEPVVAMPAAQLPTRRGLFGLFRRRAPG